ncbi:RIIa domain-containing protein 1 [Osmerus mordax]|uniref:RIIa domain-containing protein 1 n=1 Tax=Osmerus mordax TaxID=8014 RepID=UPI00350EC734
MAGNSALEELDIGALSAEQQEILRQYKIKTRIDNEKYLRAHPEVELLMSDFLRDVFLKRPVDIREFAAGHFTNPNLATKITSHLHDFTETD